MSQPKVAYAMGIISGTLLREVSRYDTKTRDEVTKAVGIVAQHLLDLDERLAAVERRLDEATSEGRTRTGGDGSAGNTGRGGSA